MWIAVLEAPCCSLAWGVAAYTCHGTEKPFRHETSGMNSPICGAAADACQGAGESEASHSVRVPGPL